MKPSEEKQILSELIDLFVGSLKQDRPHLTDPTVRTLAEKFARHTIWRIRNDGHDPETGQSIPLLPEDSDPIRRIPSDDEEVKHV